MADPLSISASIVALLQLSATVIKFLRDVKDAPADIKRLVVEISSLKGLLSTLKDAIDSGDPDDLATVQSLGGPDSPFEQCHVALKRLTVIAQAGAGKSVGKAFMWPFRRGEVADILGVLERQKTLYGLAVQNDHTALLRAIKEQNAAINEQNVAIKDGVQELQMAQKDQATRDILDWISPLSFTAKQNDIFRRRQPGTGEWFLETDAFKNWVDGTERILWCPGPPGAGKTVLASIVVDHLQQIHQMNEGVSVAYVYCSYKEQAGQTDCNLLASILHQLVQKASIVPDRISSLYQKHTHEKTRPNINEWSELLQLTVQKMTKVFVVFDALDECSDSNGRRETFLAELRKLPDIHLLVTSRPTLSFEWGSKRIVTVEISASDEDVEQYIEGRIGKEPRLERHVKADPALQEVILHTIVKNAKGMFLLAQLHMDSLAQKQNRRDVRKALEHLPTKLDDTYDEAMDRISSQNEEDSALAKRILSWLSYAFEPLTVSQLCHALATEPGDTDLDEEALTDEDLLVSVCAGLVAIDQESCIIRLVHYTTQSYFERARDELFRGAQTCITTTCLTYLSFDQFSTGHCLSDEEMKIRLQKNSLLSYAARYWGDHARGDPEHKIQDLVREFLMQQSKVSCSIQAMYISKSRFTLPGDKSQNFPKDVTGLQVAASFGLERTTAMMLTLGADVNAADSRGYTAVRAAAQCGHIGVVERLLVAGADVNASRGSALRATADRGHVEVVERLLVAGADVNASSTGSSYGFTALQAAADGGHIEVVERLLVAGADVNASADRSYGYTALEAAAGRGHVEVVERLLVAGADVNAYRGSALRKAAERGHVELVERLLATGVDVNPDGDGGTALHAAAGGGFIKVVERLLVAGADVNAPASFYRAGIAGICIQTALQAAGRGGHIEVVERLLVAGADVNAPAAGYGGRTALQAAVDGGHVEVFERLLVAGADVNATAATSYGRTALQAAAAGGQIKVVERLLAAGADVNAAACSGGRTALRAAVEGRYVGVVKRLLAAGADVNTADRDGVTVLQVAARRGHVEIVAMLKLAVQSH